MEEQREKELSDNAYDIVKDMISVYNKNKDKKEWIKEGFFEDEKYISVYYDSILSINPSGKYYTFWTSNQTNTDEEEDSLTWEIIEEELNKVGLWVESGEGSATDIFICGNIEDKEEEGA